MRRVNPIPPPWGTSSPDLETDPRRRECRKHQYLLYPGELCPGCLQEEDVADKTMEERSPVLKKAVEVLEKNLTGDEFRELGELLDGGFHDAFLEQMNVRLAQLYPQIFQSPEFSPEDFGENDDKRD